MGPIETVESHLLQSILDKINGMSESLRQPVVDRIWAQIPLWIDESAYNPALPANTPLLVGAQTSGLELIESIVVSLPAGATGIVQLGIMTIPVGSGLTTITPIKKLLSSSDTRAVQCDTEGPVQLWLTGMQLPTYGVLAK